MRDADETALVLENADETSGTTILSFGAVYWAEGNCSGLVVRLDKGNKIGWVSGKGEKLVLDLLEELQKVGYDAEAAEEEDEKAWSDARETPSSQTLSDDEIEAVL